MPKTGDIVFYRFNTPSKGVVAKQATVVDAYDIAVEVAPRVPGTPEVPEVPAKYEQRPALALRIQLDRTEDSVHIPTGAQCQDGETVDAVDVLEGRGIGQWAATLD